jgi:hypothetical protein
MLGCVVFALSPALAQERKPQGAFLTNRVEVGKPFSYSFSYRHKTEQEVFFPDSTFDFSPFEFVDQEYFTTRTDSLGSLDSTIYRLVTFDVSALQTLRLPVYELSGRDCTAVYAGQDTIYLQSSLPESARPDTLRLQTETKVKLLRRQFNYPVFLAVLASISLLTLVIYWLFGRIILKQWRLFQLSRGHTDFLRTFNRYNRNARERESIVEAEKAVVIWKEYLEDVERKPFATYTTREIVDNVPDQALEEALRDIDRIIYGQVKSNQMDTSLQTLKNVAQRIYRRRRSEILRAGRNTRG